MCGIVGILTARQGGDVQALVTAMADAICHRGPDGSGYWSDAGNGIGLGHRRLAILELTAAGDQPMVSHGGRYVLVFNGEIYNHEELRSRLPSQAWRGHADTETLLGCFEEWGIATALANAVGMFALAVWDRERHTLTLARDRFGEKPLYYGLTGGSFVFASELKAIRSMPGFSSELDPRALEEYMKVGAVPAPLSIYRGISQMLPGTWIEIDARAVEIGRITTPVAYWSAMESIEAGLAEPADFHSDEQAADELEAVLRRSVRGQMLSDVPLGAFLSGGVDSSAVVALMQAQSAKPIRTFSIGFEDKGYDEAASARAVASHLGTEHTEHYVTPAEALAVIPNLSSIYDEPFADSSQIPTYLVSRMARRHVTVSLSGDGGDEVFGGYNRYLIGSRAWRKLSRLPLWSRRLAARALRSVSPGQWDQVVTSFESLVGRAHGARQPGDKIHKAAATLASVDDNDFYTRLTTGSSVAGLLGPVSSVRAAASDALAARSLPERMMAWDAIGYLPTDILTKVDRAAMAVSLETRVPYLDHRVFAFAWTLPLHYRIRGKTGKWLLREVLYRHVPRELIERPKFGFAVPIGSWLRGPLRPWAEELLDARRLRDDGYLDAAAVRSMWSEHLSGHRNWQHQLWTVLMFAAWLEARRSDGSNSQLAGRQARSA